MNIKQEINAKEAMIKKGIIHVVHEFQVCNQVCKYKAAIKLLHYRKL